MAHVGPVGQPTGIVGEFSEPPQETPNFFIARPMLVQHKEQIRMPKTEDERVTLAGEEISIQPNSVEFEEGPAFLVGQVLTLKLKDGWACESTITRVWREN